MPKRIKQATTKNANQLQKGAKKAKMVTARVLNPNQHMVSPVHGLSSQVHITERTQNPMDIGIRKICIQRSDPVKFTSPKGMGLGNNSRLALVCQNMY